MYIHPDFDVDTRFAAVRVAGTLVASIYVPNGGRDFAGKVRFLEAMAAYVAALRATGDQVVLCGDLNITRAPRDVHPRERDDRAVCQRPEERALLARILDAGALIDVGRAQDPDNDALFTWWAPWRNLRQRNIGWRIDYVLTPAALAARATRADSLREYGTSDHAPVVATFAEGAAP
jgi:exodeoxyribonuclease-3